MRILFFLTILVTVLKLNAETHIKLADRISAKHCKKMTKLYGLDACGSGGSMMDDVKCISLTFSSNELVDIDRARFLIIKGITDLLNMVNSSQTIRPYLHDYPFTHRNLRYTVCFFLSRKHYPEDKIAMVNLVGDNLYYSNYINNDRLEDVYKESLQEALEKVKSSESK